MFIEHQWRGHPAFLLFYYLHNGMPGVLQKLCERHRDNAVLRTVDQLAATERITTEAIESERVKGQ